MATDRLNRYTRKLCWGHYWAFSRRTVQTTEHTHDNLVIRVDRTFSKWQSSGMSPRQRIPLLKLTLCNRRTREGARKISITVRSPDPLRCHLLFADGRHCSSLFEDRWCRDTTRQSSRNGGRWAKTKWTWKTFYYVWWTFVHLNNHPKTEKYSASIA